MPRSAASTPSCTWRTGCASKASTSRSTGRCAGVSRRNGSWRPGRDSVVERVRRPARRHRRARPVPGDPLRGGGARRGRLVLLAEVAAVELAAPREVRGAPEEGALEWKGTRLDPRHSQISDALFFLEKKKS